jgi:hypothetical protein
MQTATPVARAGRNRALGAICAAPRHPIRTGSTGQIFAPAQDAVAVDGVAEERLGSQL